MGPASQPPRARVPSTASLNIPHGQGGPQRTPSPLAQGSSRDTGKVAFPTRPDPADPPARTPSPLSPRHHPSEPTRVATPVSAGNRTASEPGRPLMDPAMLRTPMQAPVRVASPASSAPPPGPYGMRHPVQSTPSWSMSPGVVRSPSPSQRPRATTNTGPDLYATGGPARQPSPNPQMMPPPRTPSAASVRPYQMSIPVGGTMGPPQQQARSPQVDTKVGGDAGMAGVGRRGFAAAARAAMFAHQMGTQAHSPVESVSHADQIPGMDGRRANAPRFLDIASAANYSEFDVLV